jgi:hypothetical protein
LTFSREQSIFVGLVQTRPKKKASNLPYCLTKGCAKRSFVF